MAKRGQRASRAGKRVGERWEAPAGETFMDLRGWRERHPRAPLKEIEQELDRRLEQLRARRLADLAVASTATPAPAPGAATLPVLQRAGALAYTWWPRPAGSMARGTRGRQTPPTGRGRATAPPRGRVSRTVLLPRPAT
ncbi:MAG: hypothetical protein NVSMB65_08290 [Chloroflexota bacterium]